MSAGVAAGAGLHSLNDRFFARMPVPPWAVGLALALLFIALILLVSAVAGELFAFLETDASLLRTRDARIALVVALLAAYLPTARRYVSLELAERLPEIAAVVGRELTPLEARRTDGLLGMTIVPLLALAIDLDPLIYFDSSYWRVESAWHWIAGGFATWHAGMLIGTSLRESRRVSALAEEIPSIDLLDLAPLRPFARLGQRFALLQIVTAAVFSMNLVEGALLAASALIFVISLGYGALSAALPALGVHRCIRLEKEREIQRVNAAIRGDTDALAASPLAARASELGLADLLAYRETIFGVREWPFDTPMRLRLLLYAGIPVVSWLGGVVIEWLLDRSMG